MRFKKQRDQRPQPETPGEQTDKRRQRRFRVLFIVAIVAILGGVWLVRYPQGYVNMFLGHYEGTTSILTEMDGLTHTQEDEELLLPPPAAVRRLAADPPAGDPLHLRHGGRPGPGGRLL